MKTRMSFVVTGAGRSGTGYTSKLLTELGFPCAHEGIFDRKDCFNLYKKWAIEIRKCTIIFFLIFYVYVTYVSLLFFYVYVTYVSLLFFYVYIKHASLLFSYVYVISYTYLFFFV